MEWSEWHKHFTYSRGPFGASVTCKHCDHYESVRAHTGKLSMDGVTKAKGRIIAHLKENHHDKF